MNTFEFVREDLVDQISLVASVSDYKNQNTPILGSVLLSVGQDSIEMTGTDTRIELKAQKQVGAGLLESQDDQLVRVAVSGKTFVDLLKSMPAQAKVKLSIKEDKVVVASGKSRFTLKTLPSQDFPLMARPSGALTSLSVKEREFRQVLNQVFFAAGKNDLRTMLNGVLLDWTGELVRVVASDGYRLACCDLMPEDAQAVLAQQAAARAILPLKAVQALIKMLRPKSDEVATISWSAQQIGVKVNEQSFVCRLIEAQYPDYTRLLPRANSHPWSLSGVDRKALKESISRVALVLEAPQIGATLSYTPGEIAVSCQVAGESASDSLEVPVIEGVDFVMGVNNQFLVEALSSVENETVDILFKDANSSLVISSPTCAAYKCVVMPMRI